MDLAALAAAYNHRAPGPQTRARAAMAAQRVRLEPGDWAADVGGGPGLHAAEWQSHGVRAVVIDRELAMAESARRNGVGAIVGAAQRLPFASDSLAFTYSHLAIHYGDWKAAIDEQVRVVRPGGGCWVWTMTSRHLANPYLARWFPSIVDLDAARFPDPDDIAARFESHGAAVERLTEMEHKTRPVDDLLAAVTDRFISTLQLVPADEFDRGLESLRNDLAGVETVEYTVEFDGIFAHPQRYAPRLERHEEYVDGDGRHRSDD